MSRDWEFVVQAPASREALEHADRLARTDVSVLIAGPDGSGRKRLAEYIHRHSARREGPLHSLDCDLLERGQWQSRLYGHVAGAFPGAIADKKGLLEITAGGTLLLREIDRAPHDFQMHLLRVLEDRSFARQGREEEAIPIGCRVLATGGENAESLDERLLPGLRHLLAEDVIWLRPLCERAEDIAPLFAHFLAVYNEQHGKRVNPPDADLLKRLCELPWKGNVQELENVVSAAVCKAEGDDLSIDLLPEQIRSYLQRLFPLMPRPSVLPTSLLVDPIEKLIEDVEELTFRFLDGGIGPVPVSSLRCEKNDIEQSLVKAIIEGTLRACRKCLTQRQRARDVKDFGAIVILQRLGFDSKDNAIHQALVVALQPLLEAILQAKEETDDMNLLALEESRSRRKSRRRKYPTSARLDEVLRCYDRAKAILTVKMGEKHTRDGMSDVISQYLGKNVSAGLMHQARKEKGDVVQRRPRQHTKRIGLAEAEEVAAVQNDGYKSTVSANSTTEVDSRLDEADMRTRFQDMSGAQQENYAKELGVPLPLPDDQPSRIDLLIRARTILDHLKDSPGDQIAQLARRYEIAADVRQKTPPKIERDILIKKLMPVLLQAAGN